MFDFRLYLKASNEFLGLFQPVGKKYDFGDSAGLFRKLECPDWVY